MVRIPKYNVSHFSLVLYAVGIYLLCYNIAMVKEEGKKFVIIDGNAIMHRAYHAMPHFEIDGKLVNAIYGFISILFSTIEKFSPEYLAVAFDVKGPTFRDKIFDKYKAKRVKPPEEFYEQIPEIWEFVRKMDIPLLIQEGYEADDVIGTIANRVHRETKSLEVIILTGDQDTLQLVNDRIKVAMPKMGMIKESVYDKSAVLGKFSLSPNQIIDFKALSGDHSDNIPGVKGIGEKTATALLLEFGSIEKTYQCLFEDEVKFLEKFSPSVVKKLKQSQDLAKLSKELATIRTNLDLDFRLSQAKIRDFDKKKVEEFLQKYRFKSLLKRLPKSARVNGQQEKLF